jgi:hypothetical protein
VQQTRALWPSLLAAVAWAQAPAQWKFEGLWLGTLEAGQVKLRVVLKVQKAGDGWAATLDSVDQGAKDLPVDSVAVDGDTVKFEMPKLRAGFSGKRSADGSEIAGTWTQGAASLPLVLRRVEKAPELNRPQEPRRPLPYDETEVAYENKAAGVKLAGTLTVPRGKGPFPAALLITGSGPQDRDETIFGHRPFLVLADHLTRRGIAVLRADDRGVGKSTGQFADATTADFAADAEAGLDFLLKRPGIDAARIGLIGHSEGGLIAPMVASRRSDVAFVVLLAGMGVVGEQLLYHQGERLLKAFGRPPEAIAAQRKTQEQVFSLLKQESDPAVIDAKLGALRKALPGSLVWLRFALTYDPAPALRKVKCPVLAINGELDLQVDPDQNLPAIEAALKEGGNKDVAIAKLPKLNHLFQTAKTGLPAEYSQSEETMAPAALHTISEWIGKRVGRGL